MAWLAGIIEGEGCFLVLDSRVAVVVAMTDEDVVCRVADLFGVTAQSYFPKRVGSKRVYVARATGARAVSIMSAVSGYLGVRRRTKAQECLAVYAQALIAKDARNQSQARCSDEELVKAWEAKPAVMSLRQLSRNLGIANHGHLKNRLMRLGLIAQIGEGPPKLPAIAAPLFNSLSDELWWAYCAGFLEGEGCFDFVGRAVRVSFDSTDEDVVSTFAGRLGVRFGRATKKNDNWLPLYTVRLGGSDAERTMRNILPFMGTRRANRIEECLVVREACLRWKAAGRKDPT